MMSDLFKRVAKAVLEAGGTLHLQLDKAQDHACGILGRSLVSLLSELVDTRSDMSNINVTCSGLVTLIAAVRESPAQGFQLLFLRVRLNYSNGGRIYV